MNTQKQNSVIQLESVSVSYGNKRILANVYLSIESGHIYGIVGPNGAGKSTLYKAMLDLIPIDAGNISFWGGPVDSAKKKIAYVPQKEEVDWTFPATVKDIVSMGRYPHLGFLQKFGKKDREIVQNAMMDLGIEKFKDRQIGALSGGQQQRVFIARALAQEADVFLLDEPFVGIDVTTEQKIIEILKALSQAGKTLMVIHHDLSSVPNYFDKVILLNQRIIGYGDTRKIFTPENIETTFQSQLPIIHKTGGLKKKAK